MGNSLFDQLKKSGLIDEKKAKQAKRDKHKQAKQLKGKKPKQLAESKLYAQKVQAEKVARVRALNQQRKQVAEQNAINAQLKQLIQTNRIENVDGQIKFNFVDNNKIRLLYVTEHLQNQLTNGQLAIVKLEGRYDLVPVEAAEKIKLRDQSCIILCATNQPKDKDSDDPYADYQVPDDLMW